MAESFFSTLEGECSEAPLPPHTAARLILFRYIEDWYNPHRRHSALGHRSPIAFETQHTNALIAARKPEIAAPFKRGNSRTLPDVTTGANTLTLTACYSGYATWQFRRHAPVMQNSDRPLFDEGAGQVSGDGSIHRERYIAALVVLSIVSLGLLTTVDDAALSLAGASAPFHSRLGRLFVWLIEARLASCVVCMAVYLAVGQVTPREPRHNRLHSWLVMGPALLWVLGCVVSVFVIGVYVPSLPRGVDITAFMGFGLLAEELLFRGALFALAARTFPTWRSIPIVWTAALFSAQHLQFYHYHVSVNALVQLGYTFPMGLIFGYLRSASGRLWPAVGTHVATNAIALLHNVLAG